MMNTKLTGMPECKFGLNDKLIMEKEGGGAAAAVQQKGMGVEIDDCTFHRCVRTKIICELCMQGLCRDYVYMLRAMASYISVLLFSCSTSSGALESRGHLLPYSTITISFHVTITLAMALINVFLFLICTSTILIGASW